MKLFIRLLGLFGLLTGALSADITLTVFPTCSTGLSAIFVDRAGVQYPPGGATATTGLALDTCSQSCQLSTTCAGFNYKNSTSECTLLTSLVDSTLQTGLTADPTYNFYQKQCVTSTQVCSGAFQFEGVPNYFLVGFARSVQTVSNIQACFSACLDSKAFECQSIMWYPVASECILNSEDRRDRPDLFVQNTDTGDQVYYADNNCAGAQCFAPKVTQYVVVNDKKLGTRLSDTNKTITGATLEACAEFCTNRISRNDVIINCKSFMYISSNKTCILADERSKPLGRDELSPQTGVDYYEKQCFNATNICRRTGAFVRVPQMILVGFAAYVVELVPTVDTCLSICMQPPPEAGAGFKCKSAMYYYNEMECILNTETRTTQPSLFIPESQNFAVDYFDITCLNGETPCPSGTTQSAIRIVNQMLPAGDSTNSTGYVQQTLSGQTELQCRQACFNATSFTCLSANYKTSDQSCTLSYLSEATTALTPSTGTNYLEAICLPTTACSNLAAISTLQEDTVLTGATRKKALGPPIALEDCLASCVGETSFSCTGLNYNYNTAQCDLFDVQPGSSAGVQLTKSDVHDYYANNCTNGTFTPSNVGAVTASPVCTLDGITVQIKTDNAFNGAVFAKMRYDTCRVEVSNSNMATLVLGYPVATPATNLPIPYGARHKRQGYGPAPSPSANYGQNPATPATYNPSPSPAGGYGQNPATPAPYNPSPSPAGGYGQNPATPAPYNPSPSPAGGYGQNPATPAPYNPAPSPAGGYGQNPATPAAYNPSPSPAGGYGQNPATPAPYNPAPSPAGGYGQNPATPAAYNPSPSPAGGYGQNPATPAPYNPAPSPAGGYGQNPATPATYNPAPSPAGGYGQNPATPASYAPAPSNPGYGSPPASGYGQNPATPASYGSQPNPPSPPSTGYGNAQPPAQYPQSPSVQQPSYGGQPTGPSYGGAQPPAIQPQQPAYGGQPPSSGYGGVGPQPPSLQPQQPGYGGNPQPPSIFPQQPGNYGGVPPAQPGYGNTGPQPPSIQPQQPGSGYGGNPQPPSVYPQQPGTVGPYGGGSQTTAAPVRDCNVKDTGSGKFCTDIVVQTNNLGVPGLVTSLDKMYTVCCDYSGVQGVTAQASVANLGVSGPVPQMLNPGGKINLNSPVMMQMMSTGVAPQSRLMAKLGDPLELRWTMMASDLNMGFLVKRCEASRLGGSLPVPQPLTLIQNGCPTPAVAATLMKGPVTKVDNMTLSASLIAFRFDGSKTVQITCELMLCKTACSPVNCSINGTSTQSFGRKKRNVENSENDVNEDETYETTKYIVKRVSTATTHFTIVDRLSAQYEAPANPVQEQRRTNLLTNPDSPGVELRPAQRSKKQMCLPKSTFLGVFLFLGCLASVQITVIAVYLSRRWAKKVK